MLNIINQQYNKIQIVQQYLIIIIEAIFIMMFMGDFHQFSSIGD